MTDDTLPRYRSVYAKGYNDGLRAAGVTNPYEVPFMSMGGQTKRYNDQQRLITLIDSVQPEKEMNQAKFKSIHNGLSAIVKKVYEVVPIKTNWTSVQVVNELNRSGLNYDRKTIEGCLNSLVTSGLVSEPSKGLFIRVAVKDQPEKKVADLKPIRPVVSLDAKQKGPMELLAELASKARQFAEELDNAALEIEQEFQASEAKSEQLKQLKSLLKGITD